MHYDSLEERIAATERLFMQACKEYNFPITGDFRVSESNAAFLLGICTRTLAKKRASGEGPRAYKLPASFGGKLSYRINDLAFYIESVAMEKDF